VVWGGVSVNKCWPALFCYGKKRVERRPPDTALPDKLDGFDVEQFPAFYPGASATVL
jgi:hypothetical protein